MITGMTKAYFFRVDEKFNLIEEDINANIFELQEQNSDTKREAIDEIFSEMGEDFHTIANIISDTQEDKDTLTLNCWHLLKFRIFEGIREGYEVEICGDVLIASWLRSHAQIFEKTSLPEPKNGKKLRIVVQEEEPVSKARSIGRSWKSSALYYSDSIIFNPFHPIKPFQNTMVIQ